MQSGLKFSQGLSIRPARPTDQPFIEALYYSSRQDLQFIDGEQEFIDSIIAQQQHAQHVGYGNDSPNSMYFIIEKLQESIGRVVIDFGESEIHIVDIAFIPQARNQGFGPSVLRSLQQAAASSRAPLTFCVDTLDTASKAICLRLGFQVDHQTPMSERLIWYPSKADMHQ